MPETERPRNRRRQPRTNRTPILAAIAFIGIVLLVAVCSVVIRKYTPSKERVDLNSYLNLQAEDDMAIVLDQQLLEDSAKLWDGHVYLAYHTIRQYLNQRFYWDANENILRYTTDSNVISVKAGEKSYMVGKKSQNEDYSIVKVDGENVYLALDFVQKYTNLDFSLYEEPNRVQITASWGEISKAAVKKKTQIRVKGGIKSPIVADVKKGDSVIVLDQGEDWSKVCSEDGMTGIRDWER